MQLQSGWTVWLQCGCLVVQLGVSFVLAFFDWSFEVFIALVIAYVGQVLLLAAITPRKEAWGYRKLSVHRPCPVMLHRGQDSMGVLFIRNAILENKSISLEEFCWESQAVRTKMDLLKLTTAGLAFLVLVFEIIVVGWMSPHSRLLYFGLGSLGLFSNALEAATQPNWLADYWAAFSGKAICSPDKSTLMSAVGILLAGKFPAADTAAKLLYPDNSRFEKSCALLNEAFDKYLCANCRVGIKSIPKFEPACLKSDKNQPFSGRACCGDLMRAIPDMAGKQLKDGLASVCQYLRSTTGESQLDRITTTGYANGPQYYIWGS